MATVLDAHDDIAMCYEVYEHLLAPKDGEQDSTQRLIDALQSALSGSALLRQRALKKIEDGNLNKFVFRAMRCGVDAEALLELLQQHQRNGQSLATFAERMEFVERVALAKARGENKLHWGTKIGNIYRQLHELWPDSYVLFMLRDGRDVAASRKMVGDFGQGIEHMMEAWRDQTRKFLAFAEREDVNAHIVRYEQLVTDPEPELRAIMEFLGLPWSDRLLAHHDQDLTIYRNPTGHLSRDQVNKPMNATSIGRWKRDLTADEIAVFEREAGDLLAELGYESAGVAADS